MPPVNVYTSKAKAVGLESKLPGLRGVIARELSCAERTLAPTDISIRVIVPDIALLIADLELEMTAYPYPGRINRQDDICTTVREYIQKEYPEVGSVLVLLKPSELAYSKG